MRFFLADRIIEIDYGNYLIGIKAIALADDTFNEHFPGYPIFPGSLILEGAAQLAGSFFELTIAGNNSRKNAVFSLLSIASNLDAPPTPAIFLLLTFRSTPCRKRMVW